MTMALLEKSRQFEQWVKIAGRIDADKYTKQIFEIITKIQDLIQTHKHFDIGSGTKDLGSVNLEIAGNKYSLPVKVTMDSEASFRAAIELTTANPYLIVNLYEFRFDDGLSLDLTSKLKPLIAHEITHFVDWAYNPINSKVVEQDNPDFAFYAEFQQLFLKHPVGITVDYSNIDSFRNQPIEDIATKNVLKFIKTKIFKQLLAKYNKVLDNNTLGHLLKLIQNMYLEDVNQYRDSGGFFFNAPKTKEEKAEFKQISDVGRAVYYRSKSEMRAFINQIIAEISAFIIYKEHNKTAIALLRGNTTITAVMDKLLAQSDSFSQIKPYITAENLNEIYKAVGNYLAKTYTKKGIQEWESLAGVSLSPQEQLSYRYLFDLYLRNPAKLTEKMKDDVFVTKYQNPLMVLKSRIDYDRSVSNILRKMPEIGI